MDKFESAQRFAEIILRQGLTESRNAYFKQDSAEEIAEAAWDLTDAMQAEADKRRKKHYDFVPAIMEGIRNAELEEWQPDWSVAPNAKYWAMDKDGLYYFYKTEPEMVDNEYWDFGEGLLSSLSFGYEGGWKDSLRKRP